VAVEGRVDVRVQQPRRLQRADPLGVARGGGRVEQRLPALGAVRGAVARGEGLRGPQRRLEVGIAPLAHRIGRAHDRRVADELGGADALALRLALDQRPQGLGEADGRGSHRHVRNRTTDFASATA
jgi:hypothetical protein